jgi:hypothetical protein
MTVILYTRRTHAQVRRRAALIGALTLLLPLVVLLVSVAISRGRVTFFRSLQDAHDARGDEQGTQKD